MKKYSILLVILILVIAAVALNYLRPEESNNEIIIEPIKIGVIAPMSGKLAFMGEGIRDAIELAQESMGDTKYDYEVIFEDDELDLKKSANAANKLIELDGVDAIISFSSGTGSVVAPIAEQHKIVHLGIASDPNVANGMYNFIHWTPPEEENRVLVEELQRRGIKKLGVFESNSQGAVAVMANLREKLKGTDIEIVSDQTFNFGEKDFRSIIDKSKNSGAEIYLLMAFSPELEMLGKQIKEAGIEVPITSIEGFELSEQVDLFEGEWYINSADPTEDFANRFIEKSGKTPTLGAANAYDIFNLIVVAAEGVESEAKPIPEQIVGELMKINNYSGALGNLNVNDDGIILSKAAVRMIKDGKPVTVHQ